jgi:ABC-2 type transport system ATP-binding protein
MPTIDSASAASAKALCKSFPGGIVALHNVDFDIPFGQVTAIVGANGSGKTTLLRIFCGLLNQDSGQVRVLDQDPRERGKTFRSHIGYVSQDPALDHEMTGQETLAFFAALYGIEKRTRQTRLAHLAADFALNDHLSRRVRQYSGGLRKRLHLAVGLIHDPRFIVVDEPTAGLDPSGCDFFWSVMRSRAEQGHAVLVVSHDMDHVARYSNRVALFDKGELLLCETPSQIVSSQGSPMLQVTLSAPIKDENLRRELAAIPGVNRIQIVARQITISLENGGEAQKHILETLDRSGFEPIVIQRKSPDILTAYFNLTGRDFSVKPGGTGTKSKKKSA